MSILCDGKTEQEFISELTEAVKVIDPHAEIVPLSGATDTSKRTIETLTVGIISSMPKRFDMFSMLKSYGKKKYNAGRYLGWTLYIEDKKFNTVIHTLETKITGENNG